MSHTNSTPNYSLPQFLTTDKPAWLTDVNNAFLAIDTGLDAAKDAADNAQSDATQALHDAGEATTTANAADAKADGAIASFAQAFDAASTYAVGAYVMYNSLLYVCTTAVTTPGAWTGSVNWSRVNVVSQIPISSARLPYIASGATTTKEVIDSKSNALLVDTKQNSYTVAAGGASSVDIDVSKTGYSYLGVVGINSGSQYVIPYRYYNTSANTVNVRFKNITGSEISSDFTIYVLYVHN